MRIFLTGGTGFIGKHVFKRLVTQGHTVLLLSREARQEMFGLKTFPKRVSVIRGNLQNINAWKKRVRRFKPDVLIHLAWEGLPKTSIEPSAKNLLASIPLFLMAAESGCRHLVAVGTQWEYGDRKGAAREDDPLIPYNALAAAKIALLHFGKEIAKEKNIKFSWLRLFSVYGPGQRPGSLIPSTVRTLEQGFDPQFKSLDTKNDFIYVEDVARAISAVLKKQKPQIALYNVGSGKLTSVREIVREIYHAFGRRMGSGLVSHGQSHVPELLADISKIQKEIGWKPRTSIKDGIRKTVRYLKDQ